MCTHVRSSIYISQSSFVIQLTFRLLCMYIIVNMIGNLEILNFKYITILFCPSAYFQTPVYVYYCEYDWKFRNFKCFKIVLCHNVY